MESQKRFFPACYKNSRRCTHKNPSWVSDVASTNREQRSKVRGRKELLVCWCPDYPHGLSCVVTMTMLQWRSGPKMGCIPCIVSQKRTSILVRFQISICSLFRSGLCRSILSTWLDSSCSPPDSTGTLLFTCALSYLFFCENLILVTHDFAEFLNLQIVTAEKAIVNAL